DLAALANVGNQVGGNAIAFRAPREIGSREAAVNRFRVSWRVEVREASFVRAVGIHHPVVSMEFFRANLAGNVLARHPDDRPAVGRKMRVLVPVARRLRQVPQLAILRVVQIDVAEGNTPFEIPREQQFTAIGAEAVALVKLMLLSGLKGLL